MIGNRGRCVPLAIIVTLLCATSVLGQVCNNLQSSSSLDFTPAQQAKLSVEDAQTSVSMQPNPYPFMLTVAQKAAPRNRFSIPLPYELAQVDEICLRKGRIIVRGMVNGAIGIVEIYSETDGRPIDSFTSYWPNISVASGLIVFTKDYPSHFADGTEDHYLLYDLDMPPEANHAPGAVQIKYRPAGIPLYPMNVGNQNFDNMNLHGDLHEQMANGFFWDPDGTQAITLDSYGNNYYLILMRFQGMSAEIESLRVDPQSICETNPHAPCPKWLYLADAKFAIDKDNRPSVTAVFGHPADPIWFKLKYPLSSFSTLGERSLDKPKWTP